MSDADLNIAQTAWGDSGVYVCSVVSGQDLTGNNEDYTELIVLGKALVVTHALLVFSLGLPFICFLRGWMFITPIYAGCTQVCFFKQNILNKLVELVSWQVDIQ